MPSKKVFIKRNRPFVHEQITSEAAKEQLTFSKRGIGSYYATKNSSRMGTGLTDVEIKIILPQILDVQSTDIAFRKEVERFYTEINTLIPYERGLELEVGLELDNDKPVSFTKELEGGKEQHNTPINFEDYVKYRHALLHPFVADTPENAKGNQLKMYYIEDPTVTLKNKVTHSDHADQAMVAWQQVKNDADKVNMLLTLLRGHAPKVNNLVIQPFRMGEEEKMIALRNIVLTKPKEFYFAATDENIQRKYIVDELVSTGLLKAFGTTIIHTESSEALGESSEEVISILWSPGKSQLLSELKRQYKEIRSKQKG